MQRQEKSEVEKAKIADAIARCAYVELYTCNRDSLDPSDLHNHQPFPLLLPAGDPYSDEKATEDAYKTLFIGRIVSCCKVFVQGFSTEPKAWELNAQIALGAAELCSFMFW